MHFIRPVDQTVFSYPLGLFLVLIFVLLLAALVAGSRLPSTLKVLILLGLGLFRATEEELAKGDGLNINLWAGLGMLVVAAVFLAWVRLRPLVVPASADESAGTSDGS